MRDNICCVLYIIVCFFLISCSGGSSDGSSRSDSGLAGYYIDASNGDDANDGKSPASAWKTLARVEKAVFSASATIFLKRGETWNASLSLPANNLTIDAYGQGVAPVLDGSVVVTIITDVGAGVYAYDASLAADEGLGHIADSAGMLKFVAWQSDVNATLSTAVTGSYAYDYGSSRVYIKPASLNNPYRLSEKLIAIQAKNLSDITIKNITIQGYSLHGIQFDNCIRCSAESVSIHNIGGAVIAANLSSPPDYIYAGNGIEFANSTSSGLVKNVEVSEVFDSCLTVQTFVSNKKAHDIELASSRLSRCGFAGVELSVLSNGGTTGSTVNNITLSDLSISAAGKGWSGRRYGSEGHGLRVKADKDAGSLTGINISRVSITGSAGDGVFLAGESGVVRLRQVAVYRNTGAGINLADPDATGLKLDLATSLIYKNDGYGLSYNAPLAAGLRLVHNTFVDNTGINLAVISPLTVVNILNNVFYSSVSMTHLFISTTAPGVTIDHNCYNDGVNMFGYNGSAFSTVAAFNLATAFESNGAGNAPPALSDPATDDFTLTPTSSCRAVGVSGVGVATDYIDNAYGVPPDAGAYTYSN